jgi:hypothetical protein
MSPRREEAPAPAQIPGFTPVNHEVAVSTGLPIPVVLGLALAGLTVLAAAGFGGTVLVRRRRALAHVGRDRHTG